MKNVSLQAVIIIKYRTPFRVRSLKVRIKSNGIRINSYHTPFSLTIPVHLNF